MNDAASFLKSKMEKAAAVASQVGAAILKSTKAVSAAAAILVASQPKLQKIAEKRFAKAKARLAVSATILALLAGIFAAQNQGMASGPYVT